MWSPPPLMAKNRCVGYGGGGVHGQHPGKAIVRDRYPTVCSCHIPGQCASQRTVGERRGSCHGCCRTSAESGLATPRSCDACSTSLARCSSLLRMPESNLFGVWMCCPKFCQASVCIPGPTSAVVNRRLTGREPTDGHEQFSTEPKAPLRAVRRSRGQPAGVPGQRGDSCRLRPLHPVGTMPSTNYPVGGQV